MRIVTVAVLTLLLSGSAALAMPGASVGIPVGSPDPFGTMRRGAGSPETEAAPDDTGPSIEQRPRKPRPARHGSSRIRR